MQNGAFSASLETGILGSSVLRFQEARPECEIPRPSAAHSAGITDPRLTAETTAAGARYVGEKVE